MKRIEVYVDSALVSLPVAMVLFLAFAMGPGRRVMTALSGGALGTLAMIGPAAVLGGVLAIWFSRLLHHKDPHDPLTHDESVKAAWVALAAAVAAPVLWALQSAFGLSSPWVWMATSVVLLAVAAGLVVESIGDLVRRHMHIALDVLRLLILAPLVFAVVTSLAQPAQPGSGTEIGVWLVGGTAYMLLVALLAFGLDEIASWRTRSKQAQCHLSPSV